MYSFCCRYSVSYLMILPPLIITPSDSGSDSGPAVVASIKFLLPSSAVHGSKCLISTMTAALIGSAW